MIAVYKDPLEAGDIVTAAGWGLTKPLGQEFSNVLRKAVLEVEKREEGTVFTTVEIVNGVPVDPCGGDSGGPLLVWEQGQWRLKAILVGGGYVCTSNNTEGPGVWASVHQHYPWIQSLIDSCARNSCKNKSNKCRSSFQCLPHQSCEGAQCRNITFTTSVECTTHTDCLQNQSCVETVCTDPCIQPKVCGQSATCRTVNHRAVCSCSHNMIGNPYTGCINDPCIPSPCGKGAQCRGGECSCPKGFIGDPLLDCSRRDPCAVLPCGPGATCTYSDNFRAVCICEEGKEGDPALECTDILGTGSSIGKTT